MLAILGIGAGLALGLASGGSARALSSASLRFEYAFVGVFLIQALIRAGLTPVSGAGLVLAWAFCASATLVLASLQGNRPGLGLFALGTASNLVVVLLNDGMPAIPSGALPAQAVAAAVAAADGFYVVAHAGTIVPQLADVVPAFGGLASVGDILICVGVAVFLASSMCVEECSLQ